MARSIELRSVSRDDGVITHSASPTKANPLSVPPRHQARADQRAFESQRTADYLAAKYAHQRTPDLVTINEHGARIHHRTNIGRIVGVK